MMEQTSTYIEQLLQLLVDYAPKGNVIKVSRKQSSGVQISIKSGQILCCSGNILSWRQEKFS